MTSLVKQTGEAIMIDKQAFKDYQEDMQAERERQAQEEKEEHRRNWAQRNGNDSGYDPYWYL